MRYIVVRSEVVRRERERERDGEEKMRRKLLGLLKDVEEV